MNFNNNFIYYYLRLTQYINNIKNKIALFLQIKEIKIIDASSNIKNIILRYYIFNLLQKVINFFKGLQDMIDIKTITNKVQITKVTREGEKTLIIESDNINFTNINKELESLIPDNNMINCIFVNFELINSDPQRAPGDQDKTCLKSLVIKYNDVKEEYQHNLKNILLFNEIIFNDTSEINIKIFKDKKIVSQKILLKDVLDKHVNYFINL